MPRSSAILILGIGILVAIAFILTGMDYETAILWASVGLVISILLEFIFQGN